MRAKLFFAVAFFCAIGASTSIAQQTAKITPSGIGYLEYLPQDYTKNTNKYPIVIFLHGIGERGTTSTDPATLLSSVQKVANVGLAKYVKYGSQYPFIIVSPQLKSSYGTWPANYVMDVLNHVKKYLRVNEQRIYITGLSLGGFGTWTTLGAYPQVFAAAVPICSGGSALAKACTIAAENIPLWGFHGTGDKVVSYTVTTNMINAVNACTPKPDPLAKVTLFDGDGHIIWDKVYKQTNAINWMTSFTKGTAGGSTPPAPAPAPATNTAPVVSAGPDLNVTLATTDVYIQGTASDADGSIASYKWGKITGPAVGMTNTGGSRLRVYNLVAGAYTFRLTVTDDKGATKSDDVNLTVSAATNSAPVANAGADKTTSATSVAVSGSGTDKDGKIVSYKWEKYAGATATLTNASTPTVTVSGMTNGTYTLKLTVTDDKGATGVDYMNITVSGVTTNLAPTANAGPDKVITTRSITLYGSATDKDGRIVSYKWEKYYGPAVTLTNANTATVTLSGMQDGKYFLRLLVMDDKGATDYDYMNVIVEGGTARIYTPSMDADEVATYRFTTEGSNIIPDNITVTDFRILRNMKRSMPEDNLNDEPSLGKDES